MRFSMTAILILALAVMYCNGKSMSKNAGRMSGSMGGRNRGSGRFGSGGGGRYQVGGSNDYGNPTYDEDGPCIGLCHHNKVMAMKDPNYKGHSHKSVRGKGRPCVGLCQYFKSLGMESPFDPNGVPIDKTTATERPKTG